VTNDTDYHTRDLFEAIAGGDYPSWTLKMQIMAFDDAKTYRFKPFDLTKVPRKEAPHDECRSYRRPYPCSAPVLGPRSCRVTVETRQAGPFRTGRLTPI
jgi:hypothetical protein